MSACLRPCVCMYVCVCVCEGGGWGVGGCETSTFRGIEYVYLVTHDIVFIRHHILPPSHTGNIQHTTTHSSKERCSSKECVFASFIPAEDQTTKQNSIQNMKMS